jgi:triacylglycerol esterase/lipase EstA (alpha/beta hydrolase family)
MARYIAQACDIPNKVRNLVTVGAPNMGFSDPPKCQPFANKLLSKLIN